MRPLLIAVLVAAAVPVFAQQDYYPRHHLTFGVGAALPRGELRGPLGDAPLVSVGYGFRFNRYLQADVGFDTAFGAAGVNDYITTGFGYSRIRDRQYFVPFGGRVILPFAHERFQISGGAGGAYLHYGETLHQPSDYYHVDCPVCTARSGWGYYALANASYYFDRARHFRFGVTAKAYRGHTDGDAIGYLPSYQTNDEWLHLMGEFGFSF
jgi:hypothetical protein